MTLPREIVAVSVNNKLDIVLIASKQVFNIKLSGAFSDSVVKMFNNLKNSKGKSIFEDFVTVNQHCNYELAVEFF